MASVTCLAQLPQVMPVTANSVRGGAVACCGLFSFSSVVCSVGILLRVCSSAYTDAEQSLFTIHYSLFTIHYSQFASALHHSGEPQTSGADPQLREFKQL